MFPRTVGVALHRAAVHDVAGIGVAPLSTSVPVDLGEVAPLTTPFSVRVWPSSTWKTPPAPVIDTARALVKLSTPAGSRVVKVSPVPAAPSLSSEATLRVPNPMSVPPL